MSNIKPSIIQWNAEPKLGLQEFRLEVPIHTKGKVHVYKVPVSPAYPEGYYVALNTSNNPYEISEPPHKESEFMLLCTILYHGCHGEVMIPANIMYMHKDLVLYIHELNPNIKV